MPFAASQMRVVQTERERRCVAQRETQGAPPRWPLWSPMLLPLVLLLLLPPPPLLLEHKGAFGRALGRARVDRARDALPLQLRLDG